MAHDVTDRMLETALDFCAEKTFDGDSRRTRKALAQGRCEVCDYLCYSLAKQVGDYLGEMDKTVKAVYLFQPEYAETDEAVVSQTSGLNMIAWVERKSAALGALAAALDAAMSESRRKLGCSKATAACYALNVHMVDDVDVREQRGYGAIVHSLYVRPMPVWTRLG
jgi:hypothetical protein